MDYGETGTVSEEDRKNLVQNNRPLYLVAVTCIALFGFIAASSSSYFFESTSKTAIFSSTDLKWTLSRDGYAPLTHFTESGNYLKYKFLQGYDAVIEPNARMNLYIEGFPFETDTHYIYEICSTDENHHNPCAYGALHSTESMTKSITISCDSFTDYTISVVEYDSDEVETGVTLSGMAKCIYVRREIRDLTEEDLDATMDAMATLWMTNEEDGKALYGDKFHNSTYYTSAHYFGASQQDADHIHEGLGFLLQHIKLSNMFEIGIQAVNPSIALPYWDFTIDTAAGTSIFDNFVYQENTFGSLTPPTDSVWGWTYRNNSVDDAAIPDGRWKKLKTDYNSWYPDLRTGYSYLRAPWNMNPSPYLTRFATENTFPACSSYQTWLQKTELMMFLKYAPGPVHARTHGNVGGVFGCDKMDWLQENGMLTSDNQQRAFCSQWGFKMKDLYRMNYIVAKTDCSPAEDSTQSTCGFHCVKDNLDTMVDAMKEIMGSYIDIDLSDDEWDELKDFICTGEGYHVFYGDHLESASAADPSFWPIHPTQDRAMQAKLLAGGFSSSAWYTNYTSEWICGKPECYIESKGDSVAYYPECCLGHYEGDGFLDFVGSDASKSIGLTNGEQVTQMDPTTSSYNMPYIYDDFTWPHCEDEDIDGMLFKMYAGEVTKAVDDDTKATTTTTGTDDNFIFTYFFEGAYRA